MAKLSIFSDLFERGVSTAEIAARYRVREAFVRQILASQQHVEAKPDRTRKSYRRLALESVLQRKEYEAAKLANHIMSLREQINQLSALEVSRETLHQAIKGNR